MVKRRPQITTEDLAAENEALRATIREAHEVIKSLRVEKRAAIEEINNIGRIHNEAVTMRKKDLREAIDGFINHQLDIFAEALKNTTRDTENAIEKRLADIAAYWTRTLLEALAGNKEAIVRIQCSGESVRLAFDNLESSRPELKVTTLDPGFLESVVRDHGRSG